jgi:hypothetical protein
MATVNTDPLQAQVSRVPGRIVYIVHGSERYHDQARFAVLTFLDLMLKAGRRDIQCLVYSDRPELVPAHELVRVFPVSTAEFRQWRGPLDFVHRIKLEVMRRAVGRFGAPMVYLDTDTRWLKLPVEAFLELGGQPTQAASRKTLFLHTREGELSPLLHPRYFEALRANRGVGQILGNWKIPGSPPWAMWNAGAIGVGVGAEAFFDQALRLCDELLLRVRPRTYVEQLAVSLLAARDSTVKPLDHCVHHYWGVSAEFERDLRSFMPGIEALPTEEQARRAGERAWDESRLRGGQHAPVHRWKTRLAKMRNSIHKRRMDLKALFLRLKT